MSLPHAVLLYLIVGEFLVAFLVTASREFRVMLRAHSMPWAAVCCGFMTISWPFALAHGFRQ